MLINLHRSIIIQNYKNDKRTNNNVNISENVKTIRIH